MEARSNAAEAEKDIGVASSPGALEWAMPPNVGDEIAVNGKPARVVGRWPTAAVIAYPDGRVRVIVFGSLHD